MELRYQYEPDNVRYTITWPEFSIDTSFEGLKIVQDWILNPEVGGDEGDDDGNLW